MTEFNMSSDIVDKLASFSKRIEAMPEDNEVCKMLKELNNLWNRHTQELNAVIKHLHSQQRASASQNSVQHSSDSEASDQDLKSVQKRKKQKSAFPVNTEPNKTKKAKMAPTPPSPTHAQVKKSDNMDTEQVPSTTSQNPKKQLTQQTTTSKATPPIFLKSTHTWTSTMDALKKAKVGIKEAKATSDAIKITPSSPEDYRQCVRILEQLKLEFFTYRLPQERPLLVVIRGLPKNIKSDEVKEELITMGYPVISCSWMKTKNVLACVSLERNEAGKDIYNLKNFFNLIIKVEAKKATNGPVQCSNCQDFGHTRGACFIKPACVRCTGQHGSSECPIKENMEIKAQCANCHGEHPTTYKGCEYYKLKNEKYKSISAKSYAAATSTKSIKSNNSEIKQNPPTRLDNTPANHSRLEIAKNSNSYAKATKSKKSTHTASKQSENPLTEEKNNNQGKENNLENTLEMFCNTLMSTFAAAIKQTISNLKLNQNV